MNAYKRILAYRVQDDSFYMEFESVSACAEHFGVFLSIVSRLLSGRAKTIKNEYYCKYAPKIHTVKESGKIYFNNKAVDVYFEDEFIGTFDTVLKVVNLTGVNSDLIRNRCTGRVIKPINGYSFKYNMERTNLNRKIPVDLYDAETNEVYLTFDDISECGKVLGLKRSSLLRNLKGIGKRIKDNSFYLKKRKV